MNKVFIAIPAGDAYVHARLVSNLLPQVKGNAFLIVSGISPVAHARNIIVEQFLKTEAEYLWMIDADTIPPTDALQKMLALDKDIVSAVTPVIRQSSRTSNVYFDTGGIPLSMEAVKAKERQGSFKVEGTGAACLLVKREVFEKIQKPWFAELWSEDGRHTTEDIAFCNFAKDQGFEITCIPTIVCGHSREVVL